MVHVYSSGESENVSERLRIGRTRTTGSGRGVSPHRPGQGDGPANVALRGFQGLLRLSAAYLCL